MKMNMYGVNFASTEPTNVFGEVQACLSCLNTGVKMYNMHDKQVAPILNEFIGSLNIVNTNDISLCICGLCLYLIQKFNKFKTRCHTAFQNLHQLRATNQLTISHISSIDRKGLKLELETTKTQTMTYIPPPRHTSFETSTFHIDLNENTDDNKFDVSSNIEVHIKEVPVNYVDCTDDVQIKKENPEKKFNNIKIITVCYEEPNDDVLNNDDDFNDNDYKSLEIESLDADVKQESDDDSEKISELIKRTAKKRKLEKKKSSKKSKKAKVKKEDTVKRTRKKKTVHSKKNKVKNTVKKVDSVENETIDRDEIDMETDQNRKNAILFYNSHPTKRISQTEINKRMEMLEKFSKTYNVEIKFLSREEQKTELEERKRYYKYLPYTCDLCYRGYSIEDAYLSHMTVHDPATGDYECYVCKIRCKTNRDREKHINATHLKRFRCRQCGVVTKSQSYAKAHFARHAGATYACDTCGKRFTQQTNYLSHMRSAHSDRARHCPLCNDAFIGPLGLKVHMGIVHKQAVRCNACGGQFENGKALNKHLENTVDNVCEPGIKGCPACGLNFSSEKLMRKHYEDHHKTELKCDQCNKTFPTKYKLSTHIHEHMKSSDVTHAGGFICESCGKCNFKNLNQLRSHQRLHTGERPYKCTLCPKTFRINTLLKSHMTIHTDERRYRCPLCPKAFHQSAHRTAHLLTHTKERPYACSACPKRYTSASAAREHADTVHRGLPARRRDKQRDHR